MTAHDVFDRDQELHKSLVDPIKFSQQLVNIKNANDHYSAVHSLGKFALARVEVYRGLPSAEVDPDGYRRNLAQRSEWDLEAKSQGIDHSIQYRPLKYPKHWINGRFVVDDTSRPQEKGIDVVVRVGLDTFGEIRRIQSSCLGFTRHRFNSCLG